MMLKSIVYTSVATVPVEKHVLRDILSASTRNNNKLELTGLLIYFDGTYVQVLEGPSENVDLMIGRIRKDHRNKDMIILMENEIEEREFSQWDMGFKYVYPKYDAYEDLKTFRMDDIKGESDVKIILKSFYNMNVNSDIQYSF